jgi:hypothetical protein
VSKQKLIKALQGVDEFVNYFAEERTQTIITDIRASIENSTTLRDQFAMAASTGLIANRQNYIRHGMDTADIALFSYRLADAMLKAREESV